MKILGVCQSYYPSKGGNQTHLKAIAEKFAALGDDVTVYSTRVSRNEFFYKPEPDNRIPYSERINGVGVRRFDVNVGQYRLIYKQINSLPGGCRLGKWIMKDAYRLGECGPLCPQMPGAIIDFKPQLILAVNSANLHTYYAYQAKQKTGCSLVVMPCMHEQEDWAEIPLIYDILKSADLVIALTDDERRFLAGKGVEERKILTGGIGIDVRPAAEAAGEGFRRKYGIGGAPVVTFIGRIVEGKGAVTLIRAMRQVWEKFPQARLVLAGARTKYAAGIEAEISGYGAEAEKILFIENFNDDEKMAILKASDVFAMPSTVDSFGIVYLEAWSQARPVVACRNTPQQTIIEDGVDGLLVDPESPEELARAILRAFSDKEFAATLGRNGLEKVKSRYSWDIVIPQLRAKFQNLTEAGA